MVISVNDSPITASEELEFFTHHPTCDECPNWVEPPQSDWGWCEYREDFVHAECMDASEGCPGWVE